MANNASTQALLAVFKPMLDEVVKIITNHMTVQFAELMAVMVELGNRVSVLEKLVAPGKTPAKKNITTATTTTTTTTAGPATVLPSFRQNRLLQFKEDFKSNPGFREKFTPTNAEFVAIMEANKAITDPKTPEAGLAAQATAIWNYIKANDKAAMDEFETHFLALKALHDAPKPAAADLVTDDASQ